MESATIGFVSWAGNHLGNFPLYSLHSVCVFPQDSVTRAEHNIQDGDTHSEL